MSLTMGTSKASDTCSSETTGGFCVSTALGAPLASRASSCRIALRTAWVLRSAGCRRSVSRRSAIRQHRQQNLRDEIVDDQNQDARRHDGACRALTDALRAARRVQTEVARGDRDQTAEHEWLRQPLHEIVRDVAECE